MNRKVKLWGLINAKKREIVILINRIAEASRVELNEIENLQYYIGSRNNLIY